MRKLRKRVCSLGERLSELSLMLEKLKLADYLKHLNNIKRMVWVNFLGGVARGLGIAVGFTLFGCTYAVSAAKIFY